MTHLYNPVHHCVQFRETERLVGRLLLNLPTPLSFPSLCTGSTRTGGTTKTRGARKRMR